MKLNYLNLGCGSRFHPGWTNIDFNSTGKGVIAHNLLNGIPFTESSFEVVYHSHALEHFPKARARYFLKECRRVLKPGGIIRVALPDLEQIVRLYLELLEGALKGDEESQKRYEWIIIEMLDQLVRNRTGGEMLKYWLKNPMPVESFVIERLGGEVIPLLAVLRGQEKAQVSPLSSRCPSFFCQIKTGFKKFKDQLISLLLGENDRKALRLGRFHSGGEMHQWMYDRYSLEQLLKSAGFVDIARRQPTESYIPDWTDYCLDTEQDGSTYKPDSFYMEGVKPALCR